MRESPIILLLLLIAFQGWTQEVYSHQFSHVPDTARFEIVQSEMGARYTFRIDKYMGEVSQLVKSADDALVWQSIGIEPISDILATLLVELKDETTEPSYVPSFDKVNFQLFLSGLGIRHTYLLHIDTGVTWQLTKDPDTDILGWSLVE